MTEREIISWINTNLGPVIDQALAEATKGKLDLLYTRDWLTAIAMRETGFLIARYAKQAKTPAQIHPLMRGDYSQRPGEKEKTYHGYGYWQIDIASYPAFVESGDWKDPLKTCRKAIAVLEEKRIYLQQQFPVLTGEELNRAITAAYNCGQGNVAKAIRAKRDVDVYTHQKNYSAEVWRYREIACAVA